MNDREARLARALEWIAQLPLLGEPELARLLGIAEADAHGLRLELERRGWIEWFVPGTHVLNPRRLSFVREEAVPALAAAFGVAVDDLPSQLPVATQQTLERILRVEVTAWVNRFFADLTAGLKGSDISLGSARSLPLALPVRERWWPPGVDGYGCLRVGQLWAPYFLAWDRVGAPDEHRRRRVATWSAAAGGVAARWGASGAFVLLLVCAGERELRAWERSLQGTVERTSDRQIEVLLTTAHDVAGDGPAAAIWRGPGTNAPGVLVERLGWGTKPPLRCPRLAGGALGDASRTLPALREWASHAAANTATPARDRLAALAMTTDRDQKRLLEWIARQPLVSVSELAVLLGVPEAVVERALASLVRRGLVDLDAGATPHEGSLRRCVLTELGLLLLGRRDGVPAARYARSGGVSAPRTDGIRHREHLLGVNRVFARLALDATPVRARLLLRRNEAESTRHFRYDGRGAWIRPDGSGALKLGGQLLPFLLEYDRGTLDGGDYPAKFEGYRRYFAVEAWREDFEVRPVLLFVCRDDRAEDRVVQAARAQPDLRLLLTTDWRFHADARNPAGLLGAIWRSASPGERRNLETALVDRSMAASMQLGPERREPSRRRDQS